MKNIEQHNFLRFIFSVLPIGIILFFIFYSYQYYHSTKITAYTDLETEFTRSTQEFKTLIEEHMLAYEHVLHGTKGLFIASKHVNKKEFELYLNSLMLKKVFPGIRGVGYTMILPAKQKEPDVTQAKNKIHTRTLYIEPLNIKNQKFLNYDMSANPIFQTAMQQSRDAASAVISSNSALFQESHSLKKQHLFIMYLPYFAPTAQITTLQERRKYIQGWIFAPFCIKDFMKGLKGYQDDDFDIEVYNEGIQNSENLLYDSYLSTKESLFSKKIELYVAGRTWLVVFKSTKRFEDKLDTSKSDLILVFGLIFTLFLLYIIWQLVNHKNYAESKALSINKELLENRVQLKELNSSLEKRVNEKTKALQKSNDVLEEHIMDLEILNSKLLQAREQALQAAQARSNFISSISHELRTPLNAIINFTDQVIEDFDEMLQNKEIQEDTKQYLERVMVNSRHLLQLINDLLEFTKAEAGKIDYKFELHNLNESLQTAHNNTFSLLNGTGVDFYLNLYPEKLFASVDPRRFLQILLNLLSNAIKFTTQGSIELRSFPKNGDIIVEVADTGKGIPTEKQKSVFDPFVQVDNDDYGTGLGLGLVKRMCDDMGIEISISSVETKGSTFRLKLKNIQQTEAI